MALDFFNMLGQIGDNLRAAQQQSAASGLLRDLASSQGGTGAPATGGGFFGSFGGIGTQGGAGSQQGGMVPYQNAIAANESGGNYGALGPVTDSGDRAYGKYQVMGANIPQWTQAALGYSMTPQQFLADPGAQDKVFNHRFGLYLQQTGNPRDAASMWFTGRTLAQGGATAADQLGTTGTAYANNVARNLGAPIRLAGAPPTPDTEDDNEPAAKAKPAAQSIFQQATQPSAQPAYSMELINRLMQNPYTEKLGVTLLQNQLQQQQRGQWITLQPDKDGTIWQQNTVTKELKPVQDNSSANPTSVQEYEYGQEHPDFFKFKQQGDQRGHVLTPGAALTDSAGHLLYQNTIGQDYSGNPSFDADAERYRQTGTMPPYMGRGVLGAAQGVAIRNRAAELERQAGGDPSQWPARWQDYKAGQTSLNKFMTGKQGDAVRSFNILVDHLGVLQDAATALDNGNIQGINAARNAISGWLGKPAPTDFNGIRSIVGDELVKAVLGSGSGALGDREEIKNALSSSNSPGQMSSLIGRYRALAGGQLQGLEQQYKVSTKRDNFSDLLLPGTKEFFANSRANQGGAQTSPQFGQIAIPPAAVNFLKANPGTRLHFDLKYGAGASDRILGPQGPST